MTGPEQASALQRWRAWWLSEPARGTANPLTVRWAAILRRVTRSRTMAIVTPVLPALFVAAVAAAQLAHRSGLARAPLTAAIVFSGSGWRLRATVPTPNDPAPVAQP